jgi:hypothetical protein
VRDEVAEVAIARDQPNVMIDAGLGNERIADSGFEPTIGGITRSPAAKAVASRSAPTPDIPLK